MPDIEKRVKGRRKKLSAIWRSAEWKAKKAEFLAKNPLCSMHLEAFISEPAVVPHHPYQESYKGHYTDLELSQCVAYCKACHFAVHHGLKLCKVCGQHYHRWDAQCCRHCFEKMNPEVAKAQKEYAAERKEKLKADAKERAAKRRAKHPCKHHLSSGKCSKTKSQCDCSAKTAEKKCDKFIRREK